MATHMSQRTAGRNAKMTSRGHDIGRGADFSLRHAGRRHRIVRPGRWNGVTRAESGIVGTRLLRKGTLKLRQTGSEDEQQSAGTQFFFGTQGSLFSGSKKAQNSSLVFVAGSTGRLGARIVRELLQAGYQVRAGVRDVDAARQYAAVAVKYELLTPEQEKRLTLVPFDLEKPETIKSAIGGAVKVVCAVGAPETEVFDSTAPRRIDGEGTIGLIEQAAEAGVEQFVLVTSLGTAKFGWPASALNLFWGILTWKRKAEEALERSGMTYTIVRPGGMERPKDDYKATHNLVLGPRDTYFGGQVSRLQVAELVTAVLGNAPLAENKVLEVIAETTAPVQSFEDLLVAIPSDITKEEQQQFREAQASAEEGLKASKDKFEAAVSSLKAAEEKVKEIEAKLKQLKAEEAGTKKELSPVIAAGAKAEAVLAAARAKVDKTTRTEAALKAVLEATKKAGQKGELLSDKERQQIFQNVFNPPPPPPKEAPVARKSIFGGAKAKTVAPAKQTASEGKEPAVEVVSTPPLFAGLFGGAKAPAPAKEEEPAPEPEPVVEEKPKPAGLFGALFAPKTITVTESKPAVEEKEPEPEPAPVPKLNAAQLARQAAKEKAEAKKKAEAEAKAKAAADAKAKAEAAAKAKADAEAKAKAEAEAKKKAEVEAKAKAEAEAKKKAEAEAKAKAAAEAKAKADAEAKAKAEAEAKKAAEEAALKRKEEEARLKKEAEAAAKAAAEERARVEAAALAAIEAEKKAKEEAKAKAAAEAERKAIAEAKAKAAAAAAAAAPAPTPAPAPVESGYDASEAAARKQEAKEWIAKWAAKQVPVSNGVVKEPATVNKA